MRLINTLTLEFQVFFESTAPPYGILSHTWDHEEVSFEEMKQRLPLLASSNGYRKIEETCDLALKDGIHWIWVDTCCIDKASSAELTESINSMFRWYQQAVVCYAFLPDLPAESVMPVSLGLAACRWFTRGWTLQEPLAPSTVRFYDTKRKTTRPEDKAYCLLGIFEVSMPLIYGEGINAFRRLQEEIIRRSSDLTVFCWEEDSRSSSAEDWEPALFAPSPAEFGIHSTWSVTSYFESTRSEYSLTNKGLRTEGELVVLSNVQPHASRSSGATTKLSYFFELGTAWKVNGGDPTTFAVGIVLQKIGPNLFVREQRQLRFAPVDEVRNSPQTCRHTYYIAEARDVRDNDILATLNAIALPFLQPSSHFHVQQAIPESYWDHARHVFLRSTRPRVFAASLVTGGRIGPSDRTLLVIIRSRPPTVYLMELDKYPKLQNWFCRAKTASEPQAWSEFFREEIVMGGMADELTDTVELGAAAGNSPCRITVSLEEMEGLNVDTAFGNLYDKIQHHFSSLSEFDAIC
ncbi:heterokaryon incompatibility protein-domain-containing protein [Bombardia bombarda]|uniref:Heterokaryon incompatibility protein-domain-containing protein n=1 Tax=Bombardia bombarda TaxID=252184 RepID=A0AA39WGR6_9PEZI|nr:heterokaryon incompatibility protein-domain-containing protein [Bombardia bombarda]